MSEPLSASAPCVYGFGFNGKDINIYFSSISTAAQLRKHEDYNPARGAALGSLCARGPWGQSLGEAPHERGPPSEPCPPGWCGTIPPFQGLQSSSPSLAPPTAAQMLGVFKTQAEPRFSRADGRLSAQRRHLGPLEPRRQPAALTPGSREPGAFWLVFQQQQLQHLRTEGGDKGRRVQGPQPARGSVGVRPC